MSSQRKRRIWFQIASQPVGEEAFYGVEKRHLRPGWPSASGAHDPAYYTVINSGGLAGPWRMWSERFTPAGRWVFLASGALFMSGVNSLELQSYVPLIYASSLWFCAFLAYLRQKPKMALRVRHTNRVGAGETMPVEIEVINEGKRTARDWIATAHRLPPAFEMLPPQGFALPEIKPNGKARCLLHLRANRRGVYTLRGWRVETSFPFGLLNAARVVDEEQRLLVFPGFTSLTALAIPTGRRYQPGGVALASELGESMEYLGNREYREGDNPRDIDWRATARLQRAIVREYREEYFLRVAVVLDTHLRNPNDAAAQEAFERAVSLCAAVGDFMARQEYLVDIFAAGPNLYHLTAGRSLAYLDQILDILACVEANPEAPFETLEPEILENLAQINAVVCIFLDWDDTRRAFCERLQSSGVGLKIIIASDGPCTENPAVDEEWFGPIPIIARAAFAAGVTDL